MLASIESVCFVSQHRLIGVSPVVVTTRRPMVRALCDVGDRLIVAEGPPTNAFDPGFSLELFFLIRPLLQKLAEPDRATLLFDCAKNSEGAITIVSMTAFLGHEHGRNGGRAEMAALPAEKKRS